jgi:4-hydroxy-2-oxoheptanedioate aldolase
LHAHLGLAPSSEGAEPAFLAALERIKAEAKKQQIALGIFSSSGEAAAERVRQGFHMVSVTTDVSSLIVAATQHLRLARE